MKTPADFLAKFMPGLTPEDEAEARRLGVTVEEYRTMKMHATIELARKETGRSETPPDIAAEEAKAAEMRHAPGLLKARHVTPSFFVQAAKTPGEVAQMILFVICYLVALVGIMIFWGERVQKIPGVFQCVLLGLLIIPTMMVTSRIWAAIGERGRDVVRTLVRFWPLTLGALFFALVFLKVLFLQLRS